MTINSFQNIRQHVHLNRSHDIFWKFLNTCIFLLWGGNGFNLGDHSRYFYSSATRQKSLSHICKFTTLYINASINNDGIVREFINWFFSCPSVGGHTLAQSPPRTSSRPAQTALEHCDTWEGVETF